MCVGGGQGAAGIFERIIRSNMATATVTLPKTKGGSFLIEDRTPRRDLHAGGFHRRASRHRPHRRRVLEQGSRAERRGDPASASRASRCRCCAKSARTGPRRRSSIPEKLRRHGNGPDLGHGRRRAAVARTAPTPAGTARTRGIGTLPLLLFGTEEQKQKYLPQAGQAPKWWRPTA